MAPKITEPAIQATRKGRRDFNLCVLWDGDSSRDSGRNDMPQYRILTIDFSGHRIGAKDVECADDQEAVQQALRSITVNDVEVWQSERFVALLPRYEKPKHFIA